MFRSSLPRTRILSRPFQIPFHGKSQYSTARVRPSSTYLSVGAASLVLGGALAYLLQGKTGRIKLDAPGSLTVSGKGRTLSASEIKKHSTPESLWVVINDDVWDVTNFAEVHPGGSNYVFSNGGKDITAVFMNIHPPRALTEALKPENKVGTLDPTTRSDLEVAVDPAEVEIAQRREELPSVYSVVNLNMFEKLAEELLDGAKPWAYASSFADDGFAYRNNISSFSLVRFCPHVLVPVDKVDTSATMVKSSPIFDIPVFIAPTGRARMMNPGGELNILRASSRARIPFCISSGSSEDISVVLDERDKIAKEGGFKPILWFQLYMRVDKKESENRIRQVVNRGVDAIFFTVDTPVVGNREGDTAVHSKVIHAAGKAPKQYPARFFDANLKWEDISWIKNIAPDTPLYLKGIANVHDAKKAFDMGAQGIVLSNHGGRQLDHAPPGLATLLNIRQEYPELIKNEKFDIYIDGGVRRGTDVLKAVALGAKGVGIGRPFLYANATHGEDGIVRAAEILKEEISLGLRLLGAPNLKYVKADMVEILPGLKGEKPPNHDI